MSGFRCCIVACVLLLIGGITPAEETAQQQAVKQFRRYATNLQYNKDKTVGLIRVSKPHVKDENLAGLKQFPDLRYLAIVGEQFTDAGLQPIAGLRKLDSFFLSEAPITSDGLKVIRNLPDLEYLFVSGTQVDDRVGETLATLPKLKSLSLEKSQAGDATAKQLARLKNLESLFLDETALTDAGLSHLGQLPKLKLLSVSHCALTGKTLPGTAPDS